jgi:hypothetical protein
MASSLAEEMFLESMNTKYMCVAVEVFSSEDVKAIKLIKPCGWIGDDKDQADLFLHIVARYLWKHVFELIKLHRASRAQAYMKFCENFHMDLAVGWPMMMKAFVKCVDEFGFLTEMYVQKTIPQLMRMKYELFDMNAKMGCEQYRQVFDLVDLIYSKTMTSLMNNYIATEIHAHDQKNP